MGRVVTVTVPLVASGGMKNDPRDTTPGAVRVVTNFDIVTDQRRAIPYYDSVDGNSNSANDLMENWCVALRTGTTYSLYGLARQTALSRARIMYKNLTTGGSTDLDDAGWTEGANNLGSQTLNIPGADTKLFIFYAKTAMIYGAHTGTHIYKYDPSGSVAFVDTHHALAYTNIAQGMVHSQDDILYIPYDNKIATNNNGVWTDAALTVPAEFTITSICEYGQFIAVACAPLSGIGHSRVYLWNRTSALTSVSANIAWGQGTLRVVREVEGYLIGISSMGGTGDAAGAARTKKRVVFKVYSGASGARRFEEFTTTTNFTLLSANHLLDNRLFFMMSITLNGAIREGVWSVAHIGGGQFAVSHERTPNNDTALSNGVLRSFFPCGDFMFISYVNSSSVSSVSKTNHTASYTATSVIETGINPNMPPEDKDKLKTLLATGALYDTLPAAGQVVIKGKVNQASSYTTIFTETTDSAVRTEPVPVPSAGTYLDTGNDLEFQINSTGGGVPTAFIYKYEVHEGN